MQLVLHKMSLMRCMKSKEDPCVILMSGRSPNGETEAETAVMPGTVEETGDNGQDSGNLLTSLLATCKQREIDMHSPLMQSASKYHTARSGYTHKSKIHDIQQDSRSRGRGNEDKYMPENLLQKWTGIIDRDLQQHWNDHKNLTELLRNDSVQNKKKLLELAMARNKLADWEKSDETLMGWFFNYKKQGVRSASTESIASKWPAALVEDDSDARAMNGYPAKPDLSPRRTVSKCDFRDGRVSSTPPPLPLQDATSDCDRLRYTAQGSEKQHDEFKRLNKVVKADQGVAANSSTPEHRAGLSNANAGEISGLKTIADIRDSRGPNQRCCGLASIFLSILIITTVTVILINVDDIVKTRTHSDSSPKKALKIALAVFACAAGILFIAGLLRTFSWACRPSSRVGNRPRIARGSGIS